MKTIQAFMHRRTFILLSLLLLQIVLSAQVQWYQNQDGNSQPPNGTTAVSIQSLTNTSFIACYQWAVNSDQVTWKISKSHINGTEQKKFFIAGTTSQVQVKAGRHNEVYVLASDFPLGQNAEYILYKLDTNLVVRAQKTIAFAGSFNIFNMNAFEIDNADNLYLAGDGQYPNGPGFGPASFVFKADRNLLTQWTRMDSTQTSFTGLHVDSRGNVIVIADFYTFFPDIHIRKFSSFGQPMQSMTIHSDPGRFTLSSAMDDDDNLFLYGGKFIGDNNQGVFLYKISRMDRIVYSKTYFTSVNTQLCDLQLDGDNLYTLVSEYISPGNQFCRISRINSYTGGIYWNHTMVFAHDSCNLLKLVMNNDDKFYAVGEKKAHNILSRGFAVVMKKNGQNDPNDIGPDSIAFDRSHTLVNGIIDRNNQLIAIGNTSDMNTATGGSSYARSFAVKFGSTNYNYCDNSIVPELPAVAMQEVKAPLQTDKEPSLYPNPASNQLLVSNIDPDVYNHFVVYNMQGFLLWQQNIQGNTARIDLTALAGGQYLVVLRSANNQKEKSLKFIVKK